MTSKDAAAPLGCTVWSRPSWMLDKPLACALEVVAKALATVAKEGLAAGLPRLVPSGSLEARRHLAWACMHNEEVWAMVLAGVRGFREVELQAACDVLGGMLRAAPAEDLAEVPWAAPVGLELLRSLVPKCGRPSGTAAPVLRAVWALLATPLGWGPHTVWPSEHMQDACMRLGQAMVPEIAAGAGDLPCVPCNCEHFPGAGGLVARALAAGYIRTDSDRVHWRTILAAYSPQTPDVVTAWHDLDRVDVKAAVAADRRARAARAAGAAEGRRPAP